MADIAAPATPPKTEAASLRTVVAASSLGATFEWYDFFVFGSLTQVISKTFFSGLNETAGYVAALALFGVGFAFRRGDRFGKLFDSAPPNRRTAVAGRSRPG